MSATVRGGNPLASRDLDMDPEGCLLVQHVIDYLTTNNNTRWTLAELIDVFKCNDKQRFAVRGANIKHSEHLGLPVCGQIRGTRRKPSAMATALSFFDPRPRTDLGSRSRRRKRKSAQLH